MQFPWGLVYSWSSSTMQLGAGGHKKKPSVGFSQQSQLRSQLMVSISQTSPPERAFRALVVEVVPQTSWIGENCLQISGTKENKGLLCLHILRCVSM